MKISEEEKLLRKIDDELQILKDTQSVQSRRITELTRERSELEKAIRKQKPFGITITDHAIVRYIERVYGLDTEKLKSEIISSALTENTRIIGGSGKHTYNGITFVLEKYKIVTIYQ